MCYKIAEVNISYPGREDIPFVWVAETQYFVLCPYYHYMHLKSDNRCTAVKNNISGEEEACVPQDIDSFTWLGVRAHRYLYLKSMHSETTYNWLEKMESVVLSFPGRCWALLAFSNVSRSWVCLVARRHGALQRQGNFPSFPNFNPASLMVLYTRPQRGGSKHNVVQVAQEVAIECHEGLSNFQVLSRCCHTISSPLWYWEKAVKKENKFLQHVELNLELLTNPVFPLLCFSPCSTPEIALFDPASWNYSVSESSGWLLKGWDVNSNKIITVIVGSSYCLFL